MKKVILKQLSLKNFRGFKSVVIDFKEKSTTISGANGTGKSSVMAAFMWLLFGKDEQDRKDYQIKRLVNGESIPKTDVEVYGVLDIDGEEITLKRQIIEEWVKPRGQAEEIFKGNKTATYFNDVPLNVGEYQERINGIVDDTVFKMVTNPAFFTSMKWEKQREQLFQIAGAISDTDIAKTDQKYKALLDQISGKSFADFKREIAAKKRKAKEALEAIQPRIDQTVKLMPQDRDFSSIEKEIEKLEDQDVKISKAINDKIEAIRQQYEEAQSKQREVNALKSKRDQIVYEAESRSKEAAHEANASLRSLQSAISEAETELRLSMSAAESAEKELNYTIQRRDGLLSRVSEARSEWSEINAKEYDGSDNCPTCGQLLPETERSSAREHFAQWKSEKLAGITERGNSIKNEIEALNTEIERMQQRTDTFKADITAKEADVNKLKEQLSTLKLVEPEPVIAEEISEYVELTKQIERLEAEIKEIEAGKGEDTAELREKKRTILDRISAKKSELKDRDTIEAYRKEIATLEDQGHDLSQQIANLEQTEYVMKSFTKTKIEESEKRINSLFSFVKFKLFNYLNDGTEVETCEALVDGVPYSVANNAGRINAGLDIIRALQNHYQVLMPVIIDNAEAVNDFPAMNNQMIYLQVTRDEKLTIR